MGLPFSPPVEFVERDGTVYIKTSGDSGKVKRIKHNPSVRIAPCTIRGRLLGPPVDAVASLVDDDDGLDSLLQLFRNKYGIL